MRERLIDLIEKYDNQYNEKHLADYLLANGVIVPPCKAGDTVYTCVDDTVESFVVLSMALAYTAKGFEEDFVPNNGKHSMLFSFKSLGETVFLTKEEAEQALKSKGE